MQWYLCTGFEEGLEGLMGVARGKAVNRAHVVCHGVQDVTAEGGGATLGLQSSDPFEVTLVKEAGVWDVTVQRVDNPGRPNENLVLMHLGSHGMVWVGPRGEVGVTMVAEADPVEVELGG